MKDLTHFIRSLMTGTLNGIVYSPHTVELYQRMLSNYFSSHDELNMNNIRQYMATSFEPHQYATKKRFHEALICYLKYLTHIEGKPYKYLIYDLKDIRPKRKLPPKQTVVTYDQYEKLLNVCGTIEEQLMLRIMGDMGLRVSEVCALTWDDVDVHRRAITVQLGKGSKRRVVGIPTTLYYMLLNYPQNKKQHALFINRDGEQMRRSGIQQRMERLSSKANLDKHARPHELRRFFVTHNIKLGRPVHMVQLACGHTSIKVTMGYCRTEEDDLINEMKDW